ncbi:hypothetical protein [Massilia eurypsychrophila]|nr:hypothetical protein [Massilia eurypsychrophila]
MKATFPQTRYRLALVALPVIVAWLATASVKTENQRYALSVGQCVDKTM